MGALVRAGFERKFVVPEEAAEALLAALRRLLAPDPYTGPDGGYRVLSLYLDTPDLAAYRRETGGKWRIRRYGDIPLLFAEFKEKPASGQALKRRTALPSAELPRLLERDGPAPWFARQAQERALAPTRLVAYERQAFESETVRVTLDREIVGAQTACLALPERLDQGAVALLGGRRLLEVKFERTLPEPLERLLRTQGLAVGAFSKYREAIERA